MYTHIQLLFHPIIPDNENLRPADVIVGEYL